MVWRQVTRFLIMLGLGIGFLVGCSPSGAPEVAVETVVVEKEAEVTQEAEKETVATQDAAVEASKTSVVGESEIPTGLPAATPTLSPARTATAFPEPTSVPTLAPTLVPTTPSPEARRVELEWPDQMYLGDSDVIRLSLIPHEEGYKIQTDFPGHQVDTQPVDVPRPAGYQLVALARLDGVGFDLAPAGEQLGLVTIGEPVSWRWTIAPRQPGQQRLSISLTLRWEPLSTETGPRLESLVYARALDVRVRSFLGLTRRQALMAGVFGLLFGSGLSLFALVFPLRPAAAKIRVDRPNDALQIELQTDIQLIPAESVLLRTLFNRYTRLVIEHEFLSGYSGARTFLALPVRSDGRTDAYTIVKISEAPDILREYHNYEDYVKVTLPPVTARIQGAPVMIKGGEKAALQYTFIGEPGTTPVSLRQALLKEANPAHLYKLFDTFGPNWWMQRRVYTFRWMQEYDRKLPVHYSIEPAKGKGIVLDGHAGANTISLLPGDLVLVRGFEQVEKRPDGKSLSLTGEAAAGRVPLRVHWQDSRYEPGQVGRITATRHSFLQKTTAEFDRVGLPDPLVKLSELLNRTARGTRATIHGDLNLENALVGPGGLVWLIDFALTREGHTLYDFAHLYAEIIAHILVEQVKSPSAFVEKLGENSFSLLEAVESIAHRCLFDPADDSEFRLAAYFACLGGLKYGNLYPKAKHLLYLTAGHLAAGF